MNLSNKPGLKIRIGYLLDKNPLDSRLWSGTHKSMFTTLQRHYNVEYLGPLPLTIKIPRYLLLKLSSILRIIFKKTYLHDSNIYLSKLRGRFWKRRLASSSIDLIFTAASHSDIAFLETDIPIIFLADTTFELVKNYYPEFTNPFDISINEVNKIEKLALEKSDKIIYPTEWAAKSAVVDYDLEDDKICVIPFGPNLDQIPDEKRIFIKNIDGSCKLLFIGKKWNRKGGDLVLKTLHELEKKNIDTELTICGCKPPVKYSNEKITVHSWATKDELKNFFYKSHFLILPTRAECFGIVLAEANAYGLPSITTKTGGIPEVIIHGKTGLLLSLKDDEKIYANKICEIWKNKNMYRKMMINSRKEYENRLNWNSWALKLKTEINKLCNI